MRQLGLCVLDFPAIARPEVLIKHVSCQYALVTGGLTIYAYLGAKDGVDTNTLQVFSYSENTSETEHAIN